MHIAHSKATVTEGDLDSVASSLQGGWRNYGDEARLFEHEVSRYVGVLGGKATNSGTNALFLALSALDLNPEDEVIMPSYVCVSVLHATHYTGATPIIADIEANGYNIDPSSVKERLSRNTKAIIVPHMFGTPSELDRLLELGIPLIEDCATSMGATYKGTRVGSFGLASMFSFGRSKVITTMYQGGMALTNSSQLLEKLRHLTDYDAQEEYHRAWNFTLTDPQAAFGRSQLGALASFIERRREIASIYDDVFRSIGQPVEEPVQQGDGRICYRYIVEVDRADRYIEAMNKLGVNCARPVFKPLHLYRHQEMCRGFPNTQRAMERVVSIPIYPSLTENELDFICEAIKKVWSDLK